VASSNTSNLPGASWTCAWIPLNNQLVNSSVKGDINEKDLVFFAGTDMQLQRLGCIHDDQRVTLDYSHLPLSMPCISICSVPIHQIFWL
jgi:hypothetical protein